MQPDMKLLPPFLVSRVSALNLVQFSLLVTLLFLDSLLSVGVIQTQQLKDTPMTFPNFSKE